MMAVSRNPDIESLHEAKCYRGFPTLIATAIANLQSITGQQIRQLVSQKGKNLKKILERLEALDTPDADELLGSYSPENELTITEERELLNQYYLGKSSPDKNLRGKSEQARERLFESHRTLLHVIAKRMAPEDAGMEEEIETELQWKFYEFLERYKPESKMRFCRYFLRYAIHHLEKSMERKTVRSLDLPESAINAFRRIDVKRAELQGTLGTPPTLQELKDAVADEDKSYVPPYGDFHSRIRPETLDEDPNHQSRPETDASSFDQDSARKEIMEAMKRLKPDQKKVLTYRFGLDGHDPHSYDEIGRMLGSSKQNIHLKVGNGLTKLRHTSYLTNLDALLEGETQEKSFDEQVRSMADGIKVPMEEYIHPSTVMEYAREHGENYAKKNIPRWEDYREIFRKGVIERVISLYVWKYQAIRQAVTREYCTLLQFGLRYLHKQHATPKRMIEHTDIVELARKLIPDWELYDEDFQRSIVREVMLTT